jgi:beta-lactamase class C
VRYPVSLPNLLQANSDRMISKENAAVQIEPQSPPMNDVVLNKTGSTSGFAAYVVFIPQQKTGVVVLGNKSYPIAARVATAYKILTRIRQAPSCGRCAALQKFGQASTSLVKICDCVFRIDGSR